MFVTLQLVYTVVTFVPIPLCYRSKTAHTSLMLLAFLSCIWNGAEYYIDLLAALRAQVRGGRALRRDGAGRRRADAGGRAPAWFGEKNVSETGV